MKPTRAIKEIIDPFTRRLVAVPGPLSDHQAATIQSLMEGLSEQIKLMSLLEEAYEPLVGGECDEQASQGLKGVRDAISELTAAREFMMTAVEFGGENETDRG